MNAVALFVVVVFFLLLSVLFVLHKRFSSFNACIMTALLSALVFGTILRISFGADSSIYPLITPVFRLVSSTYTGLLKMLVIPILLTSVIASIVKLGFQKKEGRLLTELAFRSIGILLLLTAVSSVLGVAIVQQFHLGEGLRALFNGEAVAPRYKYGGVIPALLGFVPSNPLRSMVDGRVLPVVLFAVFLGTAAVVAGKKNPESVKGFASFFESSFEVVKQLTLFVIQLTPYGVFALITRSVVKNGIAALVNLLGFVTAAFLGMLLVFILQLLTVWIGAGINPLDYIRRVSSPLLVAFTTRSSFGTLPVTVSTLRDKLNLREETSSFVPSIGATLGMNACAGLWPAMVAAMTIAATGGRITPLVYLAVAGANVVASLGISGIPGTATVAASASFSLLGLPFAVVPFVQSTDFLVDMGRTLVNVNGAMTAAAVADRATKKVPVSPSVKEESSASA